MALQTLLLGFGSIQMNSFLVSVICRIVTTRRRLTRVWRHSPSYQATRGPTTSLWPRRHSGNCQCDDSLIGIFLLKTNF